MGERECERTLLDQQKERALGDAIYVRKSREERG